MIMLLINFAGIFCLSQFYLLNVAYIEGTGGRYYLILSILLGALSLFKKNAVESLRIKKSILFLALFLGYFLVKILIDLGEWSLVKSYTIETTGGVFLFVCLGVLVSCTFSSIYQRMHNNTLFAKVGIALLLLYLLWSLLSYIYIFKSYYVTVRSDLFVTEEQITSYQRPGNFMFAHFMILSIVVVLCWRFSNIYNWVGRCFIYLISGSLYVMSAVVLAVLSQIIRSNSGTVAVLGFLFMTIVYLIASRNEKIKNGALSFNIKNLFIGRMGQQLYLSIMVVSAIAIVGFLGFVAYYDIDVYQFRIFGFGEGYTSLDTRLDIFRDNFVEQMAYSPILGNAKVEVLASNGRYAHSLLSILTHMGLIGAFLFLCYIVSMYREIMHTKTFPGIFYNDRAIALYRLMSVSAVLVFCLVSAFYTWMPLWFGLGVFGFSYNHKNELRPL